MRMKEELKWYGHIILIFAFFILLAGLISLIGWHTGSLKLTQGSLGLSMPYTSSLLFCLTGIAFVCSVFNSIFYLTRMLGIVIVLVALLLLFEIFSGIHLGIQGYQPALKVPLAIQLPKISFLAALDFLLLGLIFSFLSKRPEKVQIAIVLSLGVALFCIILFCLLSSLLGIERGSKASFISLASFLIASLATFSMLLFRVQIKYFRAFMPLIIVLVVVVLSMLSFFGFSSRQIQSLHKLVNERVEISRNTLQQAFVSYAELFTRMAKRMERLEISDVEWDREAAAILQSHIDLKNIAWIDQSLKIKRIEPKGSPFLTIPINNEFINKIKNLLVYSHFIFADKSRLFLFVTLESEEGVLAVEINSELFFSKYLEAILGKDFDVEIYINQEKMYQSNNEHQMVGAKWQQEVSFKLFDEDFLIKLEPTQEFISEQINNQLILFLILAVIILGTIIAALFYLWQATRQHIRNIKNISNELAESRETLEQALKSSEMGIWQGDFKTDKISFDSFTAQLFGLKEEDSPIGYKDFINLISPFDRERVRQAIRQSLASKTPYEATFQLVLPDASSRYVITRGKIYYHFAGTPSHVTGTCWDVTVNSKNQKILESQLSLLNVLQESTLIEKAAPQILDSIGSSLNWEIALLWLVDDNGKEWKCAEFWHVPTLDGPILEKIQHTMKAMQNLSWTLESFNAYFKQVRIPLAAELGLKGAFHFPLQDDKVIYGMVELFRKASFIEALEPNFSHLSNAMGTVIALFLQRTKEGEEKRLLASIVESSKDMIFSKNLQGIITSWNKGAEDILGYSADRIIGKSIEMIYPPERRSDSDKILSQIKLGKSIYDLEGVHVCKDGRKLFVRSTISPLRDKKGEITGCCMVSRDVTVQKEAEEKLRKSEEQFRCFVETTNEWIWSIDREGKVLFSNEGVHEILGYSPEQIVGNSIYLFVENGQKEEWEDEFRLLASKRKGWVGRLYPWKHKSGEIRWLESNAEPILDNQKELVGYRGADRDVTSQKELDEVKKEFISTISHELRTPLTSILGALGLILGKSKEELSEKTIHLMTIAYTSSERLIRLVNTILDIEKMEVGKFQLNLQLVDIDDIVKEAVVGDKFYSEKYKVSLRINKLSGGLKVMVDRDRILQVISNLLSNACKFSSDGEEVLISVEELEKTVRVSIQDFGAGIPDKFKPFLFQKFAQYSSSMLKSIGGSGLGLVISKNIIEGHKGTIGFTSQEGEGSTFYFDLPKLEPDITV